jgi:hypothetical protein
MDQGNRIWLIISLVVLVLLGAVGATSALLVALGDWESHAEELRFANRVLWGTWIVAAVGVVLTRVTVFGWSFRKYFRWEGEGEPPPNLPRPTRAIWYKSPSASFGFTVAMVALTGSVAVSTVILWVVGGPVMWLAIKVVWGCWWVIFIALVLARVSVFGIQRRKAVTEAEKCLTGPEPSERKP